MRKSATLQSGPLKAQSPSSSQGPTELSHEWLEAQKEFTIIKNLEAHWPTDLPHGVCRLAGGVKQITPLGAHAAGSGKQIPLLPAIAADIQGLRRSAKQAISKFGWPIAMSISNSIPSCDTIIALTSIANFVAFPISISISIPFSIPRRFSWSRVPSVCGWK